MPKSKIAKNPVVPTLSYTDSKGMGEKLVVWPSVLDDDPCIQIDPDHMCETSRAVYFRREDAAKLATAILAAGMMKPQGKKGR
ncbi:hypothetical protein [Sinomonas mesophila]|uniref:hypothetical protein n=1 Tax=Sinomonas mesophila TaxID=1531955 RepID=UPI00158DB6CC|nr:hypothetical protein [Sinomonas mesophila]